MVGPCKRGNKPFGYIKYGEDNIKMDLQEVGCGMEH